jgi:hypothetical protein
MDGTTLFEGCRQRRPVAASGGGPIWSGHQACSAWSFVSAETSEAHAGHLRHDLSDGTWDRCMASSAFSLRSMDRYA